MNPPANTNLEPITQPVINTDPTVRQNQSVVQPTPIDTPQSVMTSNSTSTTNKNGKLKKFLLGFFVFLIVFLLIGSAGGAYAIAYKKIKINKYQDLQKKISYAVISLPFMPKTPEYILTKSAYVHQNVTRETFDISVALDSQDLSSALGLSGLDLLAKGSVDYSDTKNVKIEMSGSVTKDFSFELIKLDPVLYFKINKIPPLLLTTLGLQSKDIDPLLSKWISYDTTSLDTEARKAMGEEEVDPLSKEFIDNEFQKIIDERIISKMKMETVTENNLDLYKISLEADKDTIDYLGRKIGQQLNKDGGSKLQDAEVKTEKLSDTINNLSWQISIDKKDYYVRKIIVKSEIAGDTIDTNSTFLGTGSIIPNTKNAKVVVALNFSDFGDEIKKQKPTDSITLEEFLENISKIVQNLYSSNIKDIENSQIGRARNAKKLADLTQLRNSLEIYKSDNSKYPTSLDELKPKYISQIPKDSTGINYFYLASTDMMSYSLCTNLETNPDVYPEQKCSNPTYNFGFNKP